MNKPNPLVRGKKNNLKSTKLLLGALAVTSTLGFWNVFARQADLAAASQTNSDPSSGSQPPAQPVQNQVADLPPIPTLIPDLPQSANRTVNTNTPVNTFKPAQPPTGQIFLGGAQPQVQTFNPAPRVRTRSSR